MASPLPVPPRCPTCGWAEADGPPVAHPTNVRCPTCRRVCGLKGTCAGCATPLYQVSTLDVTLFLPAPTFQAFSDTIRWPFCSWRCLLRRLPGLLLDVPLECREAFGGGFVSLPHLSQHPWQVADQDPAALVALLGELGVETLAKVPRPAPPLPQKPEGM